MNYNSTEISITGISKILYCKASGLPTNALKLSACAGTIPLVPGVKELTFSGSPRLVINGKKEGSLLLETATLTFDSLENLPLEDDLCFAIETNSGLKLLIGSNEPDYPEVSVEQTTGNADDQTATSSFTITYKALKSTIPCIF